MRIGIIGTSKIAQEFCIGAKMIENLTIVGVCSRKLENAQNFIDKNDLKDAKAFNNFDDIKNEIDAIYIATPNGIHFDNAKFFLSHKKHVLLEKPLTLQESEAKKLIDLAIKNDVILMEAYKPLHLPQYSIIKEFVNKNNVFGSYLSMNQYSSRMDDIKKGIFNSVFDAKLGKGSTYDMLIYPVELAISLFGDVKKQYSINKNLPNGVSITNFLTLEHESGVITNIMCSKETSGINSSEIYSNDVSLNFKEITNLNEINSLTTKNKEMKALFHDKGNEINAFYYEIKEFIRLIKENDRATSNYYNNLSLKSLKILNDVEIN